MSLTGGNDFVGTGFGNVLLDAAAGFGVDANEFDGHALTGLDATHHAGGHDGLCVSEENAEFYGLAELKEARINNVETALGKIADMGNRGEVLDFQFRAGDTRVEPPIFGFR